MTKTVAEVPHLAGAELAPEGTRGAQREGRVGRQLVERQTGGGGGGGARPEGAQRDPLCRIVASRFPSLIPQREAGAKSWVMVRRCLSAALDVSDHC